MKKFGLMLAALAGLTVWAEPTPVVFVGDGFVKGWSEQGKSVWNAEFTGPFRATNLGVEGETSEALADRLTRGEISLKGVKALVVAVGGEDLKRTLAERSPLDVVLDIQRILAWVKAQSNGTVVVLSPVLPRGETLQDEQRRRGNATRIAIRDFQNAKNVLWCDPSTLLLNADGTRKAGFFAGDDRLTAKGYAAWAGELKRFLAFALGVAKEHPYPQLSAGLLFPEDKGRVTQAVPRFKRYFLNAKERRYVNKRAEQRKRALKQYDAVWVGDSTTHFWELWNGEPTFNKLFKGKYEIFNLGFGGDDTADCLWTVKWSGLYDGYKTKVICLLIGSNNIPEKATPELIADTAKGTKRIIEELQAKHPEAIILLLPTLPKEYQPDNPFRHYHAAHNDIIRHYADGKRIIWVPELWDNMIPPGGVITRDILCDGCHPGLKGYKIWGETLLPYIEKYCSKQVSAGADDAYPAADWRSNPSATITAPAELKYPGTVGVSRPEPEPMIVTIAGTADETVSNGVGSITLGLNYADGTYTWGYRSSLDFSKGRHQEAQFTVLDGHRLMSIYAYYGGPKGVVMAPPKYEFFHPSGDAVLDGWPVFSAPGIDKAGFLVRDVKTRGGFARLADGEMVKGVKLSQTVGKTKGGRLISAHVEDVRGMDRAVTLLYAVPLPKGEITWWDDPRRSRKADSEQFNEFDYTWGEECGRGPHSRWPIGAVTVGGRGIAIGIDPQKPAYYRIALNPKLRLLYIAYDLGLAAPERNFADVSLAVFGFNAEEGFRGALEKYRGIYPESFVSRVKKHGSWVAFYSLKSIKDVDDFHFRFNEYMWDPNFDDEHDILSLRYMEPCTWWMKLKNKTGGLPSYAECLDFAQTELKKGVPDARAWQTSVFKNRYGRPAGSILNKPWCFGIAWSMNAAPGIAGEMTEYKLKQSEADFQKNYGGKTFPKGVDGEYIDSSELSCTVAADYDRGHFAAMKAPLTFTTDEYRPCVFKGLSVWDYSQDLSRRLRAANRVLFANATPNHWSYLTPQMDAVGIEIGWGDGGKWQPDKPEQLIYWRAVAGDKPYCFLMSNGEKFTHEMTEKFMKLSLAYGLIPGFQPNYFFDGKGRHERDRDLWKKYMPIICRVSEALWRPVNRLAGVEGEGLVCEQFGDRLLTIYNHGKTEVKGTVKSLVRARSVRDLVSGRTIRLVRGEGAVALPPNEVAVWEFQQ